MPPCLAFYIVFGVQTSNPHACVTGTSPTELPPQLCYDIIVEPRDTEGRCKMAKSCNVDWIMPAPVNGEADFPVN